MDLAWIESLKEMLNNDEAVDKVEQIARVFFTSNAVTVNLIPAIIAGLGAALFLLPLLGIPILDMIFNAMTGTTASVGYGAAPTGGYAAPSSGYGNAYSARSGEGVELTPEQEALFPELGELREQIEGLQASEKDLKQQIYYSSGQVAADPDVNQISYNY